MTSAPSSQHPFTPEWTGTGISRGFSVGPAVLITPKKELDHSRPFTSSDLEIARFETAHQQVRIHLRSLISRAGSEVGAEEALIFEAHLMMIDDPEITEPVRNAILNEKLIPESAIQRVFGSQMQVFLQSDSEYLRERAVDLKDLETQLLDQLQPGTAGSVNVSNSGIWIMEDLSPSQVMKLDRSKILGLIIEHGGATSHSAILARSLGIPAVSGLPGVLSLIQDGAMIAIDGKEGSVFLAHDQATQEYFNKRAIEHQDQVRDLENFRGKLSLTHDLHELKLYANIGGINDADQAAASDAEGVGLFRTEFVFMGRKQAPGFDEQRKIYRKILSLFEGKEVVMRTLDIGGDKPIDYLPILKEDNPFLGVRAIRYCLKNPELFKTQIRAMLAANEWGNLSILIPMVSRASEAKEVLRLIEECENDLIQKGEYHDQPYRVGAMVEVPSLIFEMRELRESVSFVSVGTNDLMQYAMAADRGNNELKTLHTPYHLGFLRMMHHLAKEGERHGLDLGICGELGGQEDLIPLWVAMGYRKLSMVASDILSRRRCLSKLTLPQCEGVLREILEMRDERHIRPFLQSIR